MEGFKWEVELKCPCCEKAFPSYQSMKEHMNHHGAVVSEQIGVSSSDASEREDLLPCPIKTGKRSSINRKALVVIEVPSNPPPPPVQPETRLAVSTLRPWEVVDLPLKKRVLHVVRGRELNQFICFTCGKCFMSSNSLGGHRAHHKRRANMEAVAAGDQNAPPQQKRQRRPWSGGACRCLGCGRDFTTPQGLGMHMRHCKGPQPPAERNTKEIRCFDLNELPPPEEVEEMLALPWYD